jgi:rhodanese-related sulfurtransferase
MATRTTGRTRTPRKNQVVQLITASFILFAATSGSLFAAGSAESFDEALESIYEGRHNLVTGEELVELMDAGAIGSDVYLLDIRSTEEWEISRIEGAEYIGYNDFSLDDVSHIPRYAPIILYCAVGWRSGRVGRTMRDAGFSNLQDLYGGILLWADERRQMVNDAGETEQVHGRQRRWGRWVQHPEIEVVY